MDERFSALVRANRIGLIGYLSRYVDTHTAEDLAADAFALLWEKLPSLREDNLRAYLYTTARNLARNHLRRKKLILSFAEMPTEPPAADPALDELIIRDEGCRQIHAAMAELHPDYRAVLYLLYFAELSPGEAAQVLGKTEKQISNLIYRAKAALRKILKARGIDRHDALS